jgi:CubicO group peptidase (beta-lactamase class C family)
MKRKMLFYILSILVFASPYQLQSQQHGYFTAGGKHTSVASFDREVKKMMDEVGIPAVSLAIIDNNKVVYANQYGYRQLTKRDKVTPQTVFEACSLSKVYLVCVVHKLVQQGMFDLDKPMYQYLEYAPLQHDARYRQITPRMILSHSSGIENWKWDNNPDTLEIVSEPGKSFVYSGEGFQYLAKVVEGILHEPYESYINKMVLAPLQVKNTYLKYDKDSPADYATGHNDFGDEIEKWKNQKTVPASGVHTTAKDFAALLVLIFNKKELTAASLQKLLEPVVRLMPDNPNFNMGMGFFMIYGNHDTIVSFSGNNEGFKAELLYSVAHKNGFVFLTNSDRGQLITKKMCALSGGIKVDPMFFEHSLQEQYPSTAIRLLKVYRDKDSAAMFTEIKKLKVQGKLNANTLNGMAELFANRNKSISKKLLKENIGLYPSSSVAYGMLGTLYFETQDYAMAYKNFTKAKELKFDMWDIESSIKECERQMATAEKK